jgi:hypothetical protein
MHQKVQKTFFCDVTKIENFDKKCLTLTKENQQSTFKHIRFCSSKSPVKGLIAENKDFLKEKCPSFA